MRLRIVILISICCGTLYVHGQNNTNNRPLTPDWVTFALPDNDTFFFKRISISAKDVKGKFEADQLAQRMAFQAGADYLGYFINTRALNSSIRENGDDMYIDGDADKKISARLVCEYQEPETRGSSKIVTYWYLYEISKSGRKIAKFDTDFDCSSRRKTKAFRDSIENANQRKAMERQRHSNTRAIVASTFIPGLGQMLKGQGGSGAAFLLSEVVLFGGGTACYFMGQEQVKTMKNSKNFEQFKQAENMKKTLDIAMYTAFGVGAVVHIGNMVHAWVVKDKKLAQNITFAPAIIPTNEYTTPSYAYGAGVQIKF